MQLHDLLEDDDAVSPVIGVILMVAITVILAAVIGTFVLGLSDNAAPTPTASFDTTWDSSASPSNTELYQGGSGNADDGVAGGELTVTHTSGETIEGSQLSVKDDDDGSIKPFSGEVGAGDSATFAAGADDTVRVVWKSADGTTTDTLADWEGPEA